MKNIEPTEGSRDGWSYKSYKRVGYAEVEHKPRDLGPAKKRGKPADLAPAVARRYGVYGVRGEEIFVQYEGQRLADGSILGVTLLESSMDSNAYLWDPTAWFSKIVIFD